MTTDSEAALPQTLVDLVDYQPGTVVSRTLSKNESGSVTLFAFDAGQGLSEHSTPHEASVQILDGCAQVTIAERRFDVSAGQILDLPANIPHALHAGEPFKMLLTMLRHPR